MANQRMSKSLPKRVSNVHAKEARQRSWNRTQQRKEQRRAQQAARHAVNVAKGSTAWEQKRGVEPGLRERRSDARGVRRSRKVSFAVSLLRTLNKGRPIPAGWLWDDFLKEFVPPYLRGRY